MQHLDLISRNYNSKSSTSNEWPLYRILTLPPLENMKNINSTGSCYDSIPESFRKNFKFLVQTLLKFILLANCPKKSSYLPTLWTVIAGRYKPSSVSGSSGCLKCNIYSVPAPSYRQASCRRVTYIMSKSCDSCKVTCRVGSRRIYQKDHLMIIS